MRGGRPRGGEIRRNLRRLRQLSIRRGALLSLRRLDVQHLRGRRAACRRRGRRLYRGEYRLNLVNASSSTGTQVIAASGGCRIGGEVRKMSLRRFNSQFLILTCVISKRPTSFPTTMPPTAKPLAVPTLFQAVAAALVAVSSNYHRCFRLSFWVEEEEEHPHVRAASIDK